MSNIDGFVSRPSRSQSGFSIVELMVSIVIGLLVLAGVVQVVLTSKTTFLSQEDMSYIQENARYAMDVIGKDIQGAGYWGCAGAFPKAAIVVRAAEANSDASELLGVEGITGYNSVSTVGFPEDTDYTRWVSPRSTGTHETESFIVRFANGTPLTLLSNPDGSLLLQGRADLKQGGFLSVVSADCTNIGVLNISTYTASGADGAARTAVGYAGDINCSQSIQPDDIGVSYDCATAAGETVRPYGAGATAMEYLARGYFIEESGVMPGQPALKRKVLSATGASRVEEIALGVEDMSLIYSIRNGVTTTLHTAASMNAAQMNGIDWSQVVSVQISLLFRSQTQTLAVQDGDSMLGNVYGDRFQRQIVTSTFKLRNRI